MVSTYSVPSLREFHDEAAMHYAYLCDRYGFTLAPCSDSTDFKVTFVRPPLSVLVQGFSYGFALGTGIAAAQPDGSLAEIDLHLLLRLRAPELLAPRFGGERGQVEEMRFQASALDQVARDLLTGDMSEWSNLVARSVAEREQSTRDWYAHHQQHAMRRAVSQADEAFRAGDFKQAAALLAPYEQDLTTSQAVKLRVARRKSSDAA